MASWRIIEGDCVEAMAAMEEGLVDAVVCDPPYGLGFMGKDWDSPGGLGNMPMRRNHSTNTVNTGVTRQGGRQRSCEDFAKRQARDARTFQEWSTSWAEAALRVLKPGGHLLAFGGTRTYHRLACAVEDAGFEIRDTICWLYGSGFPKSLNLDGEREGWGTVLKPAHEPIVVARKPLVGTVAGNVAEYGTGALNVDGCRVDFRGEADEGATKARNRHGDRGSGARENAVYGEDKRDRGEHGNYDAPGRWPANVALDPEAADMLDAQTADLHAAGNRPESIGSEPRGDTSMFGIGFDGPNRVYEDRGGASRFFYVAKASRAERNAGLDGFEERMPHNNAGHVHADGRAWDVPGSHSTARANHHPTVKPIALMRWLVRLVTPPGGTILDPFTGSGTTGCAAVLEGFDFIGCERDPEYVPIAKARIAWWAEHPEGQDVVAALDAETKRQKVAATGQDDLFSSLTSKDETAPPSSSLTAGNEAA